MRITDSMTTGCFPGEHRTIEYTLILPENCRGLVLWLHGYQERAAAILSHPCMEQLAERFGLAVAIPNVPDTYYMDQPWTECLTETFLTSEFLPSLRTKYPLPACRESTAVCGISMGGFGALLLGSRHPECFGRIASMSGAFIIEDLLIGNPEVVGSPSDSLPHFHNLFGDIPTLSGDSARNPEAAALEALAAGFMPPVFLSCGRNDMLYSRNLRLRSCLEEAGAEITWAEADGSHGWECFEKILPDVFGWLAK